MGERTLGELFWETFEQHLADEQRTMLGTWAQDVPDWQKPSIEYALQAVRDHVLEEAGKAMCWKCRNEPWPLKHLGQWGWMHMHPTDGPQRCEAEAIHTLKAPPRRPDEVAAPAASEVLPQGKADA